MAKLRVDHVGVVVEDLEAAVAFFAKLGFQRDGRGTVEGEDVGRIVGLDAVRVEFAMVRAPDGSGRLEIVKFHAPAGDERPAAWAANRLGYRHLCIEVEGLDAIVDGLRGDGYDLVGEAVDFGGVFRLCYVRGPEGLIVELAERIGS
jgi:catechol 2,3-dioxygenase-like lactoylglutathione lyase family enzyme